MNNIFYTYIYLDPRKPGSYIYGDYIFDYKPFYVGKGKNSQCLAHLSEARNKETAPRYSNSHKFYKIKNILKENIEPIILKVQENLSEQEAFDLETWLIWVIGRSNLESGPLTNLTDGGEGGAGSIKTEEWKRKQSDAQKGKHSGEKHPMFGKHHSEETKRRNSVTQKGKIPWNKGVALTEEHKRKIGKKSKGRKHSIETKQKISEYRKRNKIIPKSYIMSSSI